MATQRVHLVRHGEVENPNGLLYERLPGFSLSERGYRMARLAAEDLHARDTTATKLIVSPLERTQQSAAPIAELLGLDPELDERVIEPWNTFAGKTMHGRYSALRRPMSWRHLVNPTKPSWGEPYREIVERMKAAILNATAAAEGGDVIVVTHQLPIWMVHRRLRGVPLVHNPKHRRCALSSITTLEYHPATGLVEVDYREPAAAELAGAIDEGAV
ncbi:histidine phosphatase family protein [Pseudoclavibacter alba]|uniref:histidine phosphatase family protein n=1 Tax=Pseudoclavibacter albus TaxID=272241 RepID=UPI0019D2190A|nr:histidine phosphatase family protein [Pseudoclavibacter alba]MBN6778605.1 histidine phosphatase family protein [Pseudoclavibacter alba]